MSVAISSIRAWAMQNPYDDGSLDNRLSSFDALMLFSGLDSYSHNGDRTDLDLPDSDYNHFHDAFHSDKRPTWIPNLALELADVLSKLPNQSWAREQVVYSMEVLAALNPDSQTKIPGD